MAVVLRSNSDLVYLPDHGFVGEDGALRILAQITRQIRRIDVSHNLLGPDGALILVQGLNSLRAQYSSADFGLWGLTEINLGQNGITDAAVDAIMGYAKKDVMLRKLYLQGNSIELRKNLESFTNSLNSSRLQTMSLTENKLLLSSSLTRLFSSLSSPHLTELHLSICDIGPELVGPISSYLQSPRSRNLELLGLNGNILGLDGVRDITDAVECGNFTIRNLGLWANEPHPTLPPSSSEDPDMLPTGPPVTSQETLHQFGLQAVRIPPIVTRNQELTKRVRRAALRCLPAARILLNAKYPSAIETAQQAMEAVSLNSHTPFFRLLDLPPEVLYLIVRHTSRDASALSDAQFARLRKDAEGGEGLQRVMRGRQSKAGAWIMDRDERKEMEKKLRDEWLRWGRWDKWECDAVRSQEYGGQKEL